MGCNQASNCRSTENGATLYLKVRKSCQHSLQRYETTVARQKLRELLIRAGFIDLGLGTWTGSEYYINRIQPSERHPSELTLVKMIFASREDRDLNLTVPEVLNMVQDQGPQKVGPRYAPNGLRKKIIQQFDRQKSLKQKLEDQNINFCFFATWE